MQNRYKNSRAKATGSSSADSAMNTRESEQTTLTERALRLLATREHSRFELRRKLLRRGASGSPKPRESKPHEQPNGQELAQAQVDTVLDDLVRRDLLSDVRFAEAFVRRGVDRGHGPIKIRADLRNRGVMEDIIDDTLTFPDEFWLRRARAVQAKRFGGGASAGGDDSDACAPVNRSEWARRARFLASRGFASDIIYRTLGPQTV